MAIVTLHTNLGEVSLDINETAAPITAQNFLEYCNNGFYDGTIFHRVIDGFMIQGGGLTVDLTQKNTSAPITNEANNNLKNEIGTIAMARTSDPHSATAQFFINVAKNDFLNFRDKSTQGWGYCVFGKVIDGMDIVKKISQVKTGNRAGHQDVPLNDIIIEKVEVKVVEKQAT